MSVVVDASLLVVLASGDSRRSLVQSRVREWTEAREELHAPSLLLYEVANGLTRLVAAGVFPVEHISDAWQAVVSIPIHYHSFPFSGDKVVRTALRLGRKSAYDVAYLVLAQDLGAELWTFDGPLARNAAGIGFPVHLVE